MNKVKILGISKSNKHNVYVLKKQQEFFKGFRQFLVDIGVGKEHDPQIDIIGRPENEYSEPDTAKELSINAYLDLHDHYKTWMYNVDVFYGQNKIVLVIYSLWNRQDKLSRLILKFCSF